VLKMNETWLDFNPNSLMNVGDQYYLSS
jgi:hypothetical protein